MLTYWLLFLIPTFALFYPVRMTSSARDWMWRAICVFFILIIGLRVKVGGDWDTYLELYQEAVDTPLSQIFSVRGELGYVLLEMLSVALGLGIYGVNLACGALVMSGIYHFCRRQPLPWLALAVAVPYLIIVVVMGYSRQGVALGLELFALIALTDGKLRRFFLLIALAALFHKVAVLLLPLGILVSTHKRVWVIVSMAGMTLLLGGALLVEFYATLWTNYVEAGMESSGGGVRVAMNALPAIILLIYGKRLAPDQRERKLWTWIATFALVCVPLVALSSTATDRVALYFMPIQLLVYSRIGRLFRSTTGKSLAVVGIVAGYGLVLWVLLNHARVVSQHWVPYDNAAFLW